MQMSIPQPKDNFGTICLLVGIAVGILLLTALKQIVVVPFYALGGPSAFCVLMVFPLPVIRKGISIELRTRMIGFIVMLTTGVVSAALTGGKFLEPLNMVLLMVGFLALGFMWVSRLEPMVYGFLGGKADNFTDESSFGMPNERFAKEAEHIRLAAGAITLRMDQSEIDTGEILLALISRHKQIAGRSLAQAGAKYPVANKMLESELGVQAKKSPRIRYYPQFPPFSLQAQNLVLRAVEWSKKLGSPSVKSEHLLLGLLDTDGCVGVRLLDQMSIDCESLRDGALQSITAAEK